MGERRLLEEVAQQSAGAVTFVALMPLSVVAAAVLTLGSASIVRSVVVGANACVIALVFLLSDADLDRIDAAA